MLGWWFIRTWQTGLTLNSDYVVSLKKQATIDAVTNLPNRQAFLEHLRVVLKRATRNKGTFLVCFMDCDGFKSINDNYGHATGDKVLQHIAKQVSGVIRENDFLARFSGDEFCLILEDLSTHDDMHVILDKILKAIATPLQVGTHPIQATMSVGVAAYPDAGETEDVLLQHADEVMYAAKRQQKNAYVIYQASSV